MAKDNSILIVIGIIVLVVALQTGLTDLFTVFQPTTGNIIQYTGTPRTCGGDYPIESFFSNNNLIDSKSIIIPTADSIFRFEYSEVLEKPITQCLIKPSGVNIGGNGVITETYIDGDNCQHWSYWIKQGGVLCDSWSTGIKDQPCQWKLDNGYCEPQWTCGAYNCAPCYFEPELFIEDFGGLTQTGTDEGCFGNIKVYQDDLLIDELVYLNELTIKNYEGIDAHFRQDSYYCPALSTNKCVFKNAYFIRFPEDYLDITLSTPEQEYLEGEDIKIDLDILNNYNEVNGKLKIKYEVPTILGTKERIDEYDIIINSGDNQFNYIIPTHLATESLIATPEIEIYFPTNEFSGANIIFDGEQKPYTYQDEYFVGSFTGDQTNVRIKSEAESLREELDLVLDDIDALQALLNTKAELLNQLELTLQEQLDLINSYELLIEEKAYLVSQLELNLQEQANLISELTSISSEQAILINSLELSVSEQADLIFQMQLTVQSQADLIVQLDLNIQEQATIIDNLNLNLQQKIVLIGQLELTNQEQTDLISQMELSFSEQQEILDALNLIISDDAQQIIDLQLTVQESAEYINELELSNQQMAQLISQLDLTIQEQSEIISALEITVEEKGQIIAELRLSLSEEADLIDALDLTIEEQIELISKLELSVAEERELVSQLKITIEEQQAIIDGLKEGIDFSSFWDNYKWIILGLGAVLLLLSLGGKK